MMVEDSKDIIKIGPRLKAVGSFVAQGAKLADIGTDHAYLPVYLLQKGLISQAVGVDVHKGPLEAAENTAKFFGLASRIDIRLGNGLIPLRPGETDTLVIAGMGGVTILEILLSKPEVLEKVSSLILQPQGAKDRVRKYLSDQGWKLKDECLVEEDGRIYTIINFTKNEGLSREDIELMAGELAERIGDFLADEELDSQGGPEVLKGCIRRYSWSFGPVILNKRTKLLAGMIRRNILQLEKIISGMSKTGREDVQTELKQVCIKKKILEVMLKWLFQ